MPMSMSKDLVEFRKSLHPELYYKVDNPNYEKALPSQMSVRDLKHLLEQKRMGKNILNESVIATSVILN